MNALRELRVRKSLHDLNPRGWICVPEAMRMLRQTKHRLASVDMDESEGILALFPKRRPWYFGQECDKGLLSAVFRSAVEYMFDVDLTVSGDHLLVFFDPASGTRYEVTDKWYDYWFILVKEEAGSVCSDDTVFDVSDTFLHVNGVLLTSDEIRV
jgi:hypothetical protein